MDVGEGRISLQKASSSLLKTHRISSPDSKNINRRHRMINRSMYRSTKYGFTLTAAVLLAACGGGDNTPTNTNTNTPPTNTNLRSGILTDAPVGGVSYSTTPSGRTGTTDANGTYQFNDGDSVTFTLGTLTLGTVPATGIVTPTELAGGNDSKLLNLLVILQSLDLDGNPTNGITIPPAAASALTAIDLAVAPASPSNNTALQNAMNAANIITPIVSAPAAQAHYIAQGMSSLSSNIWVSKTSAGVPETIVRFGANGEYVLGQITSDPSDPITGVEYGTVTIPSFDANGYKLEATTSVDTNNTAGLSHLDACDRLRSTGDELIHTSGIANAGSCTTVTATEKLAKADNDPTGIVGVWAENSPTNLREGHLALFANGRVLFYGSPLSLGEIEGIESGTYSYNATSQTLKIETVDVDTNGLNGMADNGVLDNTLPPYKFTINADGTATVIDPLDGALTFYRVSK